MIDKQRRGHEAPAAEQPAEPPRAATRRVKFYLELVEELPEDVPFEEGDVIEFEGHELVVRAVERAGAYSGHRDALAAELVVRLTPRGGRLESLLEQRRQSRKERESAGGNESDRAEGAR